MIFGAEFIPDLERVAYVAVSIHARRNHTFSRGFPWFNRAHACTQFRVSSKRRNPTAKEEEDGENEEGRRMKENVYQHDSE